MIRHFVVTLGMADVPYAARADIRGFETGDTQNLTRDTHWPGSPHYATWTNLSQYLAVATWTTLRKLLASWT